ncbi:MAG: MarR family transcriptional regulator [Chloroflexi bacterium]|nr:MarR family transcriptional regulator [Chloroflexota bacterium]
MSISEKLDQALREWVKVFMRRSMHEFLRSSKDSGLSMAQQRTLMRLHFHGSVQISEIGDDLDISAAAASQMVDRLVNLGLLERTEDPEDRRVKRINVTKRGLSHVHKGIESRCEWMKDLARSLTSKEQLEILSALETLTAAALSLEKRRIKRHPISKTRISV